VAERRARQPRFACRKPKQKIWGGERVEIRSQPGPAETAFRAEPIALDVVYEDDEVLVINKPAGLVFIPEAATGKDAAQCALAPRAQLAAIPRAGIVHRSTKTRAAFSWCEDLRRTVRWSGSSRRGR